MQTVQSVEALNRLARENDMLLIYFGGENCGVCSAMHPKLERMLERYPNVTAVELNIDTNPEMAAAFQIFSVPAVLLLVQGKVTVREAGILSFTTLEQKIARYQSLLGGE